MMNSWWGFGGGFLLTILFWIVVAFLVVAIVRGLRGRERLRGSSNASEILKERYAKGEINKKEYEEMKKTIKD